MSVHIDKVRVIDDATGLVIEVLRIGDEALGLDTWQVGYGDQTFPVEGYDAAVKQAVAMADQVKTVLPAQQAYEAAKAALADFAVTQRADHLAATEAAAQER